MVWFVCKMHFRHMCTFVSESLTVKGLTAYHQGYWLMAVLAYAVPLNTHV